MARGRMIASTVADDKRFNELPIDAALYAWDAGTLKVATMDYKAYRTATEHEIARLYRDETARLETFAEVAKG